MALHGFHEFSVPEQREVFGHQKPSPFFRANTPSIHRFSSLVFGYKKDRTCARRQNRSSLPTPSSTKNRRRASPLPAAKRIMVWCTRSRTVAPRVGAPLLPQLPASSACSSSATNPSWSWARFFFRVFVGDS